LPLILFKTDDNNRVTRYWIGYSTIKKTNLESIKQALIEKMYIQIDTSKYYLL